MSDDIGRKTKQSDWDAAWASPVRLRLPSRLNVDVYNLTRLLQRHVRPGDRYIEIGCAPGKLLAWVGARLQARTAGLDYSESGIRNCRALFASLGMDVELHQSDFFASALPKHSFDVVTSFGFIEHFDDPREAVRRHVELLRPGGTALITVPNYGGIYGAMQGRCDPANLALHNLNIMKPGSLAALIDSTEVSSVKAYRYGRMSLWAVNLEKKLSRRRVAKSIQLLANALGLLQFFPIPGLAPMLVLEIHI